MAKRAISWILLGLMVLLVSCGTSAGGGEGGDDNTPPPSTPLDCEREGYPCTREGVDPAILDLESTYMFELSRMLKNGQTMAQALEWIVAQERVIEADGDETSLFFRLEGGRPSWMVLGNDEPGGAAASQAWQASRGSLSSQSLAPAGVVGEGTIREFEREDNQDKLALFLTPFEWQSGNTFAEAMEELRKVPDYSRDVMGVWHQSDGSVTPHSFREWRTWDAIFLRTHGSSFSKGTWVSTGVIKAYDSSKGPKEFRAVCEQLTESYKDWKGVKCGYVPIEESGKTVDYVAVGLLPDFFRDSSNNSRNLEKALVYIGGCATYKNTDLAEVLAGESSVFFGWSDSVFISKHTEAIVGLMAALIELGKPAGTAHKILCLADLCGGPDWGSNGSHLRIHGSDEAKNLRLYDLPSLRHPTSGARLEGGVSLPILGVPGDGEDDKFKFVVEVTGVVDPSSTGEQIGVAQVQNSADLYDLTLLVDENVLARENLGRPSDEATVEQLDDKTYHLTRVVDLGFDVPNEGKVVTLRAEIDPLPEGGRSFHEVGSVRLSPSGAQGTITISGPTVNEEYEFSIAERIAGEEQEESYSFTDDLPGVEPGSISWIQMHTTDGYISITWPGGVGTWSRPCENTCEETDTIVAVIFDLPEDEMGYPSYPMGLGHLVPAELTVNEYRVDDSQRYASGTFEGVLLLEVGHEETEFGVEPIYEDHFVTGTFQVQGRGRR